MRALAAHFDLRPDPAPGSAPAGLWLVDGGPATVGVIASVSARSARTATASDDRRRPGSQLPVRERGDRLADPDARRCRRRQKLSWRGAAPCGRRQLGTVSANRVSCSRSADEAPSEADYDRITDTIPVTVRFFAAARDAAGTETATLASTGSTLSDAIRELSGQSDRMALVLQKCSFLSDGVAVRDRTLCCWHIRPWMFCPVCGRIAVIWITSRIGHGWPRADQVALHQGDAGLLEFH